MYSTIIVSHELKKCPEAVKITYSSVQKNLTESVYKLKEFAENKSKLSKNRSE